MPRVNNKNQWGAAGAGIDAQRSDLFKVTLNLPPAIGGTTVWSDHVEFAVEKFPFPDRQREMIPIKYLQQTNFQIGADAAPGPIDIPVRYAFNQPTAQILEKWNYLTSNPQTGAVGLTSRVKANGKFRWQVPNVSAQQLLESSAPSENTMIDGLVYILEGCLVKGLKFSDADMTSSNSIVTIQFQLQIDRYYPENLGMMTVTGRQGGFTGGSLGVA